MTISALEIKSVPDPKYRVWIQINGKSIVGSVGVINSLMT
jgi:hypothetical protein